MVERKISSEKQIPQNTNVRSSEAGMVIVRGQAEVDCSGVEVAKSKLAKRAR
jgi:hypothetical protein